MPTTPGNARSPHRAASLVPVAPELPGYRCWAEVDLRALEQNLLWIRHRVGPEVQVLTVVKADAYGHGLKAIARQLMQHGTDIFGVANLAEARTIRAVGPGWPILLLSACLPDEVDTVVQEGLSATVSSFEEARAFSQAAVRLGRTCRVHLKLDTGMGRLGAKPAEALSLLRRMARLPHLTIEGLMTHFAIAEDDVRYTQSQLAAFRQVLERLPALGLKLPLIHAANSAGLLHEPESRFNLVRPGLLVYGVLPTGKRTPPAALARRLKPVLAWKSRVTLVKRVSRGASLSYGCTYTTKRATRLAIVGAGYGDGYHRTASNRGQVLIRGQRCRILGRVTMDQMIVDVTALRGVRSGDEVVLLGHQGRGKITAQEVADWFGTIPYEVFTGITGRVQRVYLGAQAS